MTRCITPHCGRETRPVPAKVFYSPEFKITGNIPIKYEFCTACRASMHRYFIDPYDFLVIMAAVKCPICKYTIDTKAIDHDHATGKVRGLICQGCNVRLGRAERSGEYSEAQLRYLSSRL